MNFLTRVFLVLLRLAIGWHFLFEGIEKIESVNVGPTTTNRPWTSEPYLREASGPFGDYFRRQIGDPDDIALAKLTVQPLPPGQDPARMPLSSRFPSALGQEWNAYFEAFVSHYRLERTADSGARADSSSWRERSFKRAWIGRRVGFSWEQSESRRRSLRAPWRSSGRLPSA